MASSINDFTVKTIDGKDKNLSEYAGKVLLIVNVASKCGLTPQYADLQFLYNDYADKGLEILGFPANNFGAQEPGTDEEIKTFCSLNYEVTFPMFAKISVKGEDKHPLYQYLTEATGSEVTWNFQKFLVGRDGKVIRSIAPTTKPDAPEAIAAINQALGL